MSSIPPLKQPQNAEGTAQAAPSILNRGHKSAFRPYVRPTSFPRSSFMPPEPQDEDQANQLKIAEALQLLLKQLTK